MTLQLTPHLEMRLEHLAAESHRQANELAQEALESYLKQVEVLTGEVREGEESAEREGWFSTEVVLARLSKRVHTAA